MVFQRKKEGIQNLHRGFYKEKLLLEKKCKLGWGGVEVVDKNLTLRDMTPKHHSTKFCPKLVENRMIRERQVWVIIKGKVGGGPNRGEF